jgi:hypothetical protein
VRINIMILRRLGSKKSKAAMRSKTGTERYIDKNVEPAVNTNAGLSHEIA